MEMLLSLIQSINIIVVIAFFLTSIFLGYEIYLTLRQKKQLEKPVVPNFNNNEDYGKPKVASLKINDADDKIFLKTPNSNLILGLVIVMIFFGALSLIGLFTKFENEEKELKAKQVTIKTIKSNGIKIYNSSWVQMTNNQLSRLKAGDNIYIGIATISDLKSDINKARIKVNRSNWDANDLILYNDAEKVFYKKYEVASNEAKLKIEAQLYSKKYGWLSDDEAKK